MTAPPEEQAELPLPPAARFLKRLVLAMAVAMIGGVLTLVAAILVRLNAAPLPLPDSIALPDGAVATAFTQGSDWFAVVTDDDRILIFDRLTGALRQTVAIAPSDSQP